MHELCIGTQTEPLGNFRTDVGSEVVAGITHVGIAEDTIFIVVTERQIVLRTFTTAAGADIMVLLERPVLVVEVEVVGVTDT